MRTDEGLVVKRLDWEPTLLTYGSEIIGEVRWVTMVGSTALPMTVGAIASGHNKA